MTGDSLEIRLMQGMTEHILWMHFRRSILPMEPEITEARH